MAKNISQRISLEGWETIRKAFTELGDAGEKAFNEIRDAVSDANKELNKTGFRKFRSELRALKTEAESLGRSLQTFGRNTRTIGLAGVALTAAVGGIGVGLLKLSKDAVASVQDIEHLAEGLGFTTEQFTKLRAVLQTFGVTDQQIRPALASLNRQISVAAQEQVKTLKQLTIDIAGTLQSGPFKTIGELPADFQKVGEQLPAQFQTVTSAFDDLAQQLRPLAEQIVSNLQLAGVEKSVDQVTAALRQRLAGGATEAREQLRALGVELPKAADVAQRLAEAIDDGAVSLKDFNVNLLDEKGRFAGTEKSLKRIMDLFARLDNETQAAALSLQLLPEIGPKVLKFLREGRAGYERLTEALGDLGAVQTKVDEQIADEASTAFGRLDTILERLRNRLGLVFAPAFTEAANRFARALGDNQTEITRLAESVRNAVIPIFRDLFNLITGRDDLIENTWIISARDGIVDFANAVTTVFNSVVIPAFRAAKAVFDTLANAFDAVFGTKITGGEAAIALLLGRFTGLNLVIADLVRLLGKFALAIVSSTAIGAAAITRLRTAFIAFGALGLTQAIVAIGTLIGLYQDLNRVSSEPLDVATSKLRENVASANIQIDSLKENLADLQTQRDRLANKEDNAFGALTAATIESVEKKIAGVTRTLDELTQKRDADREKLQALNLEFARTGQVTGEAGDQASEAGQDFSDLSSKAQQLASNLRDVATAAGQAQQSTGPVFKTPPGQTLPENLQQAQATPQQAQATQAIVSPFQQALPQIQAVWNQIIAVVGDLSGLIAAVQPIAAALVAPFQAAADGIVAALAGLPAEIGQIMQQIEQSARQAAAAIQSVGAAASAAGAGGPSPSWYR